MELDSYHSQAVVQLLEPQTLNGTDTNSLVLDTAGFYGAELWANLGTVAGTIDASNYLTPVAQHSDTTVSADFVACGVDDLIGAFSVVNSTSLDQTIQRVGYKGRKRYLRVKMDFTGTTITGLPASVTGVLTEARHDPPTAPAAITAT